jgi:hypothetical protein
MLRTLTPYGSNRTFSTDIVATTGELVGTTMFLFFAFACTQVANIQFTANPFGPSTNNWRRHWIQRLGISLYFNNIRLPPNGQCLDLLPHLWRIVQSCRNARNGSCRSCADPMSSLLFLCPTRRWYCSLSSGTRFVPHQS